MEWKKILTQKYSNFLNSEIQIYKLKIMQTVTTCQGATEGNTCRKILTGLEEDKKGRSDIALPFENMVPVLGYSLDLINCQDDNTCQDTELRPGKINM
jgi:hypothetical protein